MQEEKYTGVIIEESLSDSSVLQDITISNTQIEPVTDKHKTPWVKQWTMHNIEISSKQADVIAKKLKNSLDKTHDWYADFKNDVYHYIIFNDKVFKVTMMNPDEYKAVTKYGIDLGIPAYQMDFTPHIVEFAKLHN
jgi:hypothetical protein